MPANNIDILTRLVAANDNDPRQIIGNPSVPEIIRNVVSDIFDPTYRLLRRVGRRNGPEVKE